jgi:DNA repair exonuclease SbcCD ATPase subunit
MIQSIQIKNFQSHKNTTLEFSDGLNIVIGTSDCGKTAILRALRLLIWNRPGGDAYRSHWGGDTEITLTTENNTISRGKGKENYYDLDKKHFVAMGTEVPKEIADALNIQEINFARQFDQPFLLTSTPGEVASHWNSIAHLEKIDTSTKKVQSWINGLNQDIKTNEKDILKNQQELGQYAYLEKMEIELEVLEGMEKDLQTHYSTLNKLTKLTNEIQSVEAEIQQTSKILTLEEQIVSILFDYDLKESVLKDFNALSTLLSTYEEISDRIALKQAVIALEPLLLSTLKDITEVENLSKEQKKIIDLCDNLYAVNKLISDKNKIVELEPMIQPILDLYEEIKTVQQEQKALTDLVSQNTKVEYAIKKMEENVVRLSKQFEKEIGSECPLCGQTIEHKH